jgi:3-methyladenine DNA glycosylase AlkC
MAEPLKSYFNKKMITEIAERLASADRTFPKAEFLRRAVTGLDELELLARGHHVADVLADLLPRDFEKAAKIIIASLGPSISPELGNGMDPFKYLPFVFYVEKHGLDSFDAAMRLQYEVTKRFSSERSIRAFIIADEKRTMKKLREWASDPDPHVRRLVSEGTRPRLPWAQRLKRFQEDPAPVLELLELLKDDPSLYVRRSVANNLNDIGKDHPEVLAEVCRRWLKGASEERRWLVEHALRDAIKKGHSSALAVLGHSNAPKVKVEVAAVEPARVKIGERARISFRLKSASAKPQSLLVDLGVHFVKANGSTAPKVFKLKRIELPARGEAVFEKSISFAVHTTRKPNPGRHKFDVRVNGAVFDGCEFLVR